MPGGGKAGHIHPDLGDDDRGGNRSDAGYLIQPCRCCRERDQMRLDLVVEGGDIGLGAVDAVQHPGQQEPVMIIEVTVERFLKAGDLGAHPGAGHLRQHVRVAFAGDQRGHHRPSGDPENCRRRPPTA